MEISRMPNIISMSRRRRNWLVGIAAVAGVGYGVYRLYQSPSISMKKLKIVRFGNSLILITEAASASAQTISLVSNDLKAFLESDTDEVPRSLQQLFKVAQCQEFRQALTGFSGSLTAGIIQGLNVSTPQATDGEVQTGSPAPAILERILDKLFTTAGTGFASVVVGNFARNLVLSFLENYGSSGQHNNDLETQMEDGNTLPNARPNSNPHVNPPVGSGFADVLCSGKFRLLIADCMRNFVSTAVTVYLDKTMDINSYDQICSGLTNPRHEAQMKGMLISVFNGAVETLIRTSYDVFTSGSSSKSAMIDNNHLNTDAVPLHQLGGPDFIASSSQLALGRGKEISICDSEAEEIDVGSKDQGQVATSTKIRTSSNLTTPNGWVDKISHTLAVPGNRKLLVELSGRVTFEAVRSFFEFLLCKFSDFFKTTLAVVNHDALDKMLQIMRYAGARSLVVATVCLAICLHFLTGVRALQAV